MKKFFLAMVLMGLASISSNLVVYASTSDERIKESCNYTEEQNQNPTYQMTNCLITEMALAYDIPPEIVKAIAEGESSGWKQFDENGNPVISDDHGIGLMQITHKSDYDVEKLKTDIIYNTRAGVEILDYMFERNDLPTINDGERDVLENWYFAIMAYNGIKPVNSPIVQATGERNPDAYQEETFENMKEYSLIERVELPFTVDDFNYDTSSTSNIEFVTMNYDFSLPLTKTSHLFETGQKVRAIDTLNIRPNPTTEPRIGTLAKGEVVEITGPFVYDKNEESKNHFVWYPIKRSDGTTGYVASSYLAFQFSDVANDHYAEESIYYLADRGILYGVGNGKFGMGQKITRWQVVLMLLRANNTSLEDRPDPGFTDVPKSHEYYKEIAAAVDEGLFSGNVDGTFKPYETMTRAEMAIVLNNLYDLPEATANHPFTDLTASWYKDAVARLYDSGITGGVDDGTKYGPQRTVTREQFAAFMVRAMDENYRLH